MEEQLLHFIWHRKLFDQRDLMTTEGEPLVILHAGIPNSDQGPDFLQGRVSVANQLWAGHVEIHILSSAWYLHRHEKDPHYNNVILHVVWKEDVPVHTSTGFRIPCMELESRVDKKLLQRYHQLMNNQEWVPCASGLMEVSALVRTSWLERMMAERLEYKTNTIHQLLDRCGQHWEQVFFVLLARQLGASANSDTMEELCIKIPWTILRRHGNRTDQIEAILFGVAGMLDKDSRDPYVQQLRREFQFLQKKYQLISLPGLRWKFMRMRPVHFPTIRIAQLAVLIKAFEHFITLLENMDDAEVWIRRFTVKPQHEFWNTHYHFASESPDIEKYLGRNTGRTLIINVVAPLTFVYGKLQGRPEMKDHALKLLRELPAEENTIIQAWKKCGWSIEDAGQTQGLLHLKKHYCDARRCMHCAIGLKVLQ